MTVSYLQRYEDGCIMQPGKHFEDFDADDEHVSGWKEITETHLVTFLNNTGMIEPLFDDPVFREESAGHTRQMVPGFLTMSTAYGFFTQSNWLTGTGLALVDCSVSFEDPVYVDDDLRCVITVDETTPTSSNEGGIVKLDWDIETRSDGDITTVATMESNHFVKKRGE